MERFNKNRFIAFIDPALFINGMIFLNINTVIPYFLLSLSASSFHISFANFLVTLGSFLPSLFVARFVQKLRVKTKVFAKLLFIQRLSFLLFSFFLPFLIKSLGNTFTIYMFLLFYGIFNMFVGTYGPFYFSIINKILPYGERGKIIGRGSAVGNLVAILTTYLLNFYLNRFSFPYNFVLIFFTGMIILFIDAVLFYIIDEPEEETQEEALPLGVFLLRAFSFLKRDLNFKRLVFSFIFLGLSLTSLPYFIVYATKSFKGYNFVTIFNLVAIIVSILGNYILGELTKILGYKKVLSLGILLGILGLFLALIFKDIYFLLSGFALLNLTFVSNILTTGFLITSISPKEDLPVYLALSNTLTMSISSLMHIANGFIINYVGFEALFLISLIFLVISLFSMERVVTTSTS
ncbi:MULTISPECIES: MFS transporter [Dictyoglomus]|uniref:Major facilitator superfamily MFS_1 n=1 Tax=Dictyoglomus turgidum (strain DSM 6724 / Z-1310) TaxID=515635 RepID=B8DYI3_DICTD|nr:MULTISPECIES: MFS transporter [Dictyoglomus]ACK41365.1 major facilitator superfamily MFS_1 [Dictyoglomus turgidum DSM 6724]HBU31630.1 MFS transporter [Dictyoglomus sp.]